MQGAGEQGKGRTLKARRESGRGASYHARTRSRRVVPQDLQGEGLQRGHGASKPSSTEAVGVTEGDPVGLKLIESKGPWARVEEPETGGSHAGRQQVGGDTRSMVVETGRAEFEQSAGGGTGYRCRPLDEGHRGEWGPKSGGVRDSPT